MHREMEIIIMIKINKLSKKFKDKSVLTDLNIVIGTGELIYIHGINGSGKSTLFKIICDILEKDNGEIVIDDNVSIGALIENPMFMENQSMAFNLKLLAELNNNYDKNCINELCIKFDLDINDTTKIKDYSVGMRQKVGIIQAIMENQNCIFLDEPTRGLDEKSICVFIEIINKLVDEGKTVVIASHDRIDGLNYSLSYELKNGKLTKG